MFSNAVEVSTLSKAPFSLLERIRLNSYRLLLRKQVIIGICHADGEKSIKNISGIFSDSLCLLKIILSNSLFICVTWFTLVLNSKFQSYLLQFVNSTELNPEKFQVNRTTKSV